jgi:hypothetical protein
MEWIGFVADIIGISGALFALLGWQKARQVQEELEREKIRQNKEVQVVLAHGADKIELSVELRRAELTRSEILGRIGMIPTKKPGRRFAIASLNTPEFLKQINQVAMGSGEGILTIPCTKEEMEQFDL